jgi:beta-N-acetylhexosaminidase
VSAFLACGVAGTVLEGEERRLLAELRPGGVTLFGRNVEGHDQLRELVAALRELPSRPYVAVDLEGGRVNRLEKVIGPLPSAAEAVRGGREAVLALAEAAASACAHFGITVDLAPVADVARPGGFLASEARCLGSAPGDVRENAALFLAGLASYGVAGCLKHYPGLGSGAVDSHRALPVLGEEAHADSEVFRALAAPGCAVMVAHALVPSLGEADLPATLSPVVVRGLPRAAGPILADDLEMGALSAFGTIPERAAAALAAGCDQVLVCNALDARRAVVEHVRETAQRDGAYAAALRGAEERVSAFGRSAVRDVGWEAVRRLAERARRLAESGA